jgi:Xaa-Pro aminopeptidase
VTEPLQAAGPEPRARAELGRFARGQFRTDYEARPDLDRLREARLERAQRLLAESELDALLVWKDENVRYLTGLRAQLLAGKSALLNGCLLLPDRAPILLVSGGDLARVRETMPWIDELHAIPIMEAEGLVRGAFEQTIVPLVSRLGLDSARFGLDECSFVQVKEFARALPEVALDDGDTLMQQARRIKLAEEIALMEEACAIGEGVLEAAFRAIRPGVRENDVAAEAMHALYRLGGETAHVMTPFVASGEHMSPPFRLSTDKIIREGDLVFVDIGAMWAGYFGDLARTTVCGKPSRRQQEVYTAVYQAHMAGIAAMGKGATNDDVARTIVAVAAEHGLAENFISLFIGHGIGVGSNEPPYIGESLPGAETVPLEVGMTFAVEPLIWVPGVRGGGGVRLEDTVMVDVDGGLPLSRAAFDERLLLEEPFELARKE